MSDTVDDQALPRFRARVLTDLPVLRQQIDQQEPVGEAEILVAVFGIPDTHVAVGNTKRQIIDRGSFAPWIASSPFPSKFYRDHGGAIPTGIYKSAEMIGSVRSAGEMDEGLVIRSAYNLRKQVGRDMFSDLLHEPDLVDFSFASDPMREKVVERDDGFEHVVEIWPTEFSQVGEAAQELARLITARSPAWTPDEIRACLGSEEFMTALGSVLVEDPKRAGDVKRAAEAALAGRPENEEGAYYRQLFDLGGER